MRWLALLSMLSLVGCVDADELLVFLPIAVDEYELPNNRIPEELLEEVTLTSTDGTKLFAYFADQPSDAPTVIFLHGQASNIDEAWHRVMALWEEGWRVFAVDYRGYGKSEGTPSEAGLYADARAAFSYLLEDRGLPPSRVVIVGFSMGTGVASQLAVDVDAAALILGAPFTSMHAMIEGSAPGGIPHGWVSEVQMDTLAKIPRVGMPVIVAHGTSDDRIPFRFGEEVFRHARPPKRFLPFAGVNHGDLILEAAPSIANAVREIVPNGAP